MKLNNATLKSGWIETELGECLEVINGRAYKLPEMLDSGTPILRIQNLNKGDRWFYSNLELDKNKYCEEGDLLYAWSATFGPYIWWGERSIYHYHIWKIKLTNYFDKKFAYYLLKEITDEIKAAAHGVAMPHITKSGMEAWRVMIPPLNEQRRIVSTIEQLTDRSNKARAALKDVPKLIAQFRQSVLAAAFRGDLTADWREKNPDVEPASELLERIKIDSSSILKNKYSNTTSYEQLPDGWCWTRVDSVGKVSLGRQRSPKYHQGTQMRPYMRSANITWKGWDLSDVNEMNFDDRDFATFKLECGDVLINEGSGSADEVGKPAIWNDEIPDCCFQNTLISVRPFEKMSKYIYFVFLNAALSKAFVEETRGVNIHHIGKQGLTQFLIPLTSLQEQVEIVSRIEKCFQSIQSIEEQYKTSHGQLDILDRSILAKAFRGELVPQDPNDEPAAVLLDRIRAEREQTSTPKQRGKTTRKNSSKQLSINLE